MARLEHAALTFLPGQEAEVRRFYADVLGFEETPLPGDLASRVSWIWFATDDPGVFLHFIPDEIAPDSARRHHIAFQVDALGPVIARLEEADIYVETAVTGILGRERFFCHDPLGNLLEFLALTD
jgi:catechol 2,3-dioxygenase-like lactoylglutathione lyase family enzyme